MRSEKKYPVGLCAPNKKSVDLFFFHVFADFFLRSFAPPLPLTVSRRKFLVEGKSNLPDSRFNELMSGSHLEAR